MALVTRQAQLAGQGALVRFAMLNPLGANLAIGPLITLLALTYGASDFQTGLMYASMHLCGIVLLVTPTLCGGLDASRVYAGAWTIRSLLGLAYLALPFLTLNQVKIWLLIVVYFGFMAARSVGVSASQVVLKALSRPGELAEVVSRQLSWWYVGTIAISLLSAGVLTRAAAFPSQEWAFFPLLALGVVFNLAASWALARVPPTGALPRGTPLSILGALPGVLRDAERREVILLTLLMVPMGIAAGYHLNYLKVVLKLPSDVVFMTSIGGMVAMLAGSHLAGVVGRTIGFRPLQFGAHGILAICGVALAWCGLLPPRWQPVLAIALYVLASLCLAVSGAVFSALSIDRLGDSRRLETSILFQLAASLAAALGLGLVALAKAVSGPGIPGGHDYSHVCLVWALCSLAVCWASQRLRRPGDDAWGDITMLHPANLVTAIRLHQVETSRESLLERMHNLEHVLVSGTAVSRKRILACLRSPDPAIRASAYRSLLVNPYPDAAPLALREGLDPVSPLRREALTALGFMQDRAHVPALRQLLDMGESRVAASALKSLLRLGEVFEASSIMGFWHAWKDPADRQELLVGLSATGQAGILWTLIRAELAAGATGRDLQLVLLHLAHALGERAEICELWTTEAQAPGRGQEFVFGELQERDAWRELAVVGADRTAWRARVAARLGCALIPDDLTAVSLLLLASKAQPPA